MKQLLSIASIAAFSSCRIFEGAEPESPRAFLTAVIDSQEVNYPDCNDEPFEAVLHPDNSLGIRINCGNNPLLTVSSGGSRASIHMKFTGNGTYVMGDENLLSLSIDGSLWTTSEEHIGQLTIRTGRYAERVEKKYDEYIEGEFSANVFQRMSQLHDPPVKHVSGGRFHLRLHRMK